VHDRQQMLASAKARAETTLTPWRPPTWRVAASYMSPAWCEAAAAAGTALGVRAGDGRDATVLLSEMA